MAREVVDIYGNHQFGRRFRLYSADGEQASVGLVASRQGRRGRKWRNGALLQGQLFKKRRVAHSKEYVLPDGRQHRFHGEAPPREKQAP